MPKSKTKTRKPALQRLVDAGYFVHVVKEVDVRFSTRPYRAATNEAIAEGTSLGEAIEALANILLGS